MRTTTLSILAASAATAVFAGGAIAQTDGTFLLVSTNTVSPTTPTTTIEIWATWVDPGADYVFIGADYDLAAGDGAFSNPVNILQGPNSTTGVIAGNVISGAINGQLHVPFLFFGSPDNPILLATYDWTTADFTPRSVSLDTSNTMNFVVATFSTGFAVSLFPHEFTPGSGFIDVVPGPAAWFVLALPLAAAARRRLS